METEELIKKIREIVKEEDSEFCSRDLTSKEDLEEYYFKMHVAILDTIVKFEEINKLREP
jgi:hypothetical protein